MGQGREEGIGRVSDFSGSKIVFVGTCILQESICLCVPASLSHWLGIVGGEHGLHVYKMGASVNYTPCCKRPERVGGAKDLRVSWWNLSPPPLPGRPPGHPGECLCPQVPGQDF